MSRRTYDDEALLALVGEVMALEDVAEFRVRFLRALMEVMPARYVSLNDVAADGVVAYLIEPAVDESWYEKFAQLGTQNPLYQYHARTGDGRAYRFSDVVTREELEATRLYREVYLPLGVRHQIAFALPNHAGRVLGVALSRELEDFSDEERDFLNRARPYLIQAYRNALVYSDRASIIERLTEGLVRAGLTPREADVVRMVAFGASNRSAAQQLGLSARTVQKHLQNAFPKLGVSARAEAAARAWDLAPGDQTGPGWFRSGEDGSRRSSEAPDAPPKI